MRRSAKATGLRNLPFWGFAANDAWLSLVCIAQTPVCWAQALLLDGDCKLAEPKTLRFRLWHVAGRIVRHARCVIVRIDRTWPWATDLVTAFARLRALPARCYRRSRQHRLVASSPPLRRDQRKREIEGNSVRTRIPQARP
jgi:Transposase DDE domain group 1